MRARRFDTCFCAASLLAVVSVAACRPGDAADPGTRRVAQTASDTVVFTIYTPDGGIVTSPGAEEPPAVARPLDPEYLARQRQYLKAAAEEVPRWQALGLSENEVARRQAELKRSILGD